MLINKNLLSQQFVKITHKRINDIVKEGAKCNFI